MTFRIHYQIQGAHVWCRLYAARAEGSTGALAGEFVLRSEEFEALKEAFASAEYLEDERDEHAHARSDPRRI